MANGIVARQLWYLCPSDRHETNVKAVLCEDTLSVCEVKHKRRQAYSTKMKHIDGWRGPGEPRGCKGTSSAEQKRTT
jgi:hypothetical protein